MAGLYSSTAPSVIDQLAVPLGLAPAFDDPLATYSDGMLQKIYVLALVSHNPSLLLIDEPGHGWDESSQVTLIKMLERYRQNHGTVVMASHDPRFIDHPQWRTVPLDHGTVLSC